MSTGKNGGRVPKRVVYGKTKQRVTSETRHSRPAEGAESFFKAATRNEREELYDKFLRGLYVPDIPPAKIPTELLKQVSSAELDGRAIRHLLTAESLARRSHGAIRSTEAREFAQFPAGPRRRQAYLRLSRFLRQAETPVLRSWASEQGLLFNRTEFDLKWDADGRRGESEHQIFFEPDTQRWWKRNLLSFHNSALEYLQRIALHNFLFPQTALRFEGFIKMEDQLLAPVVSQQHVIAARGAQAAEVRETLLQIGFEEKRAVDGRPLGFYLEPLGIWLEDLHDENAFLTQTGALAVIDPVLFLNHDSKLRRLCKYFDEQS